jgi:hypothetical protein
MTITFVAGINMLLASGHTDQAGEDGGYEIIQQTGDCHVYSGYLSN